MEGDGGRAARGAERHELIDNLLVRIHFIIVMIRWTGLAPWEFEFPFSGSLTPTFLGDLMEDARVEGNGSRAARGAERHKHLEQPWLVACRVEGGSDKRSGEIKRCNPRGSRTSGAALASCLPCVQG